ncbi:unnamed protein product [Lactuca saligna]|uniref:Response regulatory domain-containing protein n=1 Tax=Lactuca saligna TaxID=75948 RepID=A0AA35ZR53_LACSI|nr:unnamed protein product [Lactuca saligna]
MPFFIKMTITTFDVTVVPKRFRDLRVLLIESEKSSLDQHAYMLSHNSYQVTTTSEVATGLLKILNGELYDCVLIDADISEMDMVDFLHQTFKHQPHLSIIMMASHNTHMRLLKEIVENEAVLYLPKPCGHKEICNIWKHVCRKIISFEGYNYSIEESPEGNQEPNIFKRVDQIIKQSTNLNPKFINNNLSSKGFTQEGLNINSLEYNDMFKRTNDQLVEDEKYYKKTFDTKKRISWTSVHHKKFAEATNTLGKQKADPSAILEVMNVSGLTRSQIASHLKKYQENQKSIKKPTLIPQKKKKVERYAYNICGQSTPTNDYESIPQSSNIQPPLTLNSIGMSYMTINNIKARLQRAPPLPIPQPKTTINNSYSDQSTDHSFCRTSLGETSKNITFGLVESCNGFIGQRNEVQMTRDTYESTTGLLKDGETIAMTTMDFGEVVAPVVATSSLTPLNYSGTSIEKSVSRMAPSYYGLGTGMQPLEGFALGGENYDLKMHKMSNVFGMINSIGGHTLASSNHNYLIHSQDLQGNNENLSPKFLRTPTDHDDVGEENIRQAQTLPPFNSLGLVDGIKRTTMESDMFADETQFYLDMTVNLLDELDDDLINGPW